MRFKGRCVTTAVVLLVFILSASYFLNSIILTLTRRENLSLIITNATNTNRNLNDLLRSNTSAVSGVPDYTSVPKITTAIIGGVGNVMFQYAAAFAIGKRNGFYPVFPLEGKGLSAIFTLPSAGNSSIYHVDKWRGFTESKACSYDHRMANLRQELKLKSADNGETNVQLRGFFQSWKYFDEYSEALRREFTFRPAIMEKAQSFLSQSIAEHLSNSTDKMNSPILVGIHVRRGDMLTSVNVNRGYTVASEGYIRQAMNYFIEKFPQAIADKRFMFVVASNDLPWSREYVRLNRTDIQSIPIVFSTNTVAEIDLAILASCNHTIATVGTFSWWAGWLSGGIVTYYRNFPTPGTFIDMIFNAQDHWKPEWIGLKDS